MWGTEIIRDNWGGLLKLRHPLPHLDEVYLHCSIFKTITMGYRLVAIENYTSLSFVSVLFLSANEWCYETTSHGRICSWKIALEWKGRMDSGLSPLRSSNIFYGTRMFKKINRINVLKRNGFIIHIRMFWNAFTTKLPKVFSEYQSVHHLLNIPLIISRW